MILFNRSLPARVAVNNIKLIIDEFLQIDIIGTICIPLSSPILRVYMCGYTNE